ncbi:MAG: hypothetical protein QM488_02620, partial [Rhizobiaceae bacterium]
MAFKFDETAFFKRLRELIRSKDENYDALAAKCDIPFGTFCGYLYSQNEPTTGKLAQLCHGLETTSDWLLFGDIARRSPTEKLSRYRVIQNGIPIAEFSGYSEQVLNYVGDYIAAYKSDVPATIEVNLNG